MVTVPEAFSRYRGRIDLRPQLQVHYGRIDNLGSEPIAVEEVLWDDIESLVDPNDLSEDLDKIEIFLAEDIPANTSLTY